MRKKIDKIKSFYLFVRTHEYNKIANEDESTISRCLEAFMVNILKNSNIRFGKLFIHSILLTVILTIIANVGKDIVALILEHPLEYNITYVNIAVITWIFFALQSNNYKKEEK